jgi:PKD repeat protein
MAINYVKGQILSSNLERDGVNLSISNANVGINKLNPVSALDVNGNVTVGNVVISNIGNISAGNVYINNLRNPVASQDAATRFYVDQAVGNASGNLLGNVIQIGTPTDGSLTINVAYPGWTTATYVTDGLDDLNQVALNIANGTYVGQASLVGTPTSGASPITVAFTGNYIGNANAYLWDFGDGTTAATRNPSHVYSNVSGGTYSVSFTAYNTNGTYSGNAALGAKGSTVTATRTNYITLYTPTPTSAFTIADSQLDTGDTATISNASSYANYFELNWGDGTANATFASGWTTKTHVYSPVANTDTRYGVVLSATSNTSGPANVTAVSSTGYFYVYTPQSPAVTANTINVIN